MTTPNPTSVYWTNVSFDSWNFPIAATSVGLCYVGSLNEPFDKLEEWTASRFPSLPLVRDDERLQPYATQLIEYLQGARTDFSLSLDARGTPFQQAVWNALLAIPYGRTCSYTDIANAIGKPAAVRAVGSAIGANPVLITVPCHRVIGKNGALTGYRGGMEMKKRLLGLELGDATREEAAR